jgi:hypothetical protein
MRFEWEGMSDFKGVSDLTGVFDLTGVLDLGEDVTSDKCLEALESDV